MATDQVTSAAIELRIAAADWARLRGHLFPGDHDEHAAVLLCGMATSARSSRLLVREVVLAPDGVAYVPGTRGYRQLTGEFVTHLVRRARMRSSFTSRSTITGERTPWASRRPILIRMSAATRHCSA